MSFPALETEAGEKAAKEETAVVENTTPDYAAGLVSAQVLHMLASLKQSGFSRVSSHITLLFCFSETGGVERESSAVDQLPAGHTQHGSLLLLHSQLRGPARSDKIT